jgi:hypothetical protein
VLCPRRSIYRPTHARWCGLARSGLRSLYEIPSKPYLSIRLQYTAGLPMHLFAGGKLVKVVRKFCR